MPDIVHLVASYTQAHPACGAGLPPIPHAIAHYKITPDPTKVTCPACQMNLIVEAARAARQATGDPVDAEAAAQAKAKELGVELPSDDFCLHGEYGVCPVCDPIFS